MRWFVIHSAPGDVRGFKSFPEEAKAEMEEWIAGKVTEGHPATDFTVVRGWRHAVRPRTAVVGVKVGKAVGEVIGDDPPGPEHKDGR